LEDKDVESITYHTDNKNILIDANNKYILDVLAVKDVSNDDETSAYDDEPKHGQRLLKIGKLCKEINEWPTQKKKDFFYGVKDITEHNFNLLKSIYPDNRRLKFWDKFMIETGLVK
jgi:hypothetical protein